MHYTVKLRKARPRREVFQSSLECDGHNRKYSLSDYTQESLEQLAAFMVMIDQGPKKQVRVAKVFQAPVTIDAKERLLARGIYELLVGKINCRLSGLTDDAWARSVLFNFRVLCSLAVGFGHVIRC